MNYARINEIKNAIEFLQGQIESDLMESKKDISGHYHINIAIRELEDIIDPTHGYGE